MKKHKYKSNEEYIEAQLSKTTRHPNKVFVLPTTIDAICDYLHDEDIENGLCHGVRSGAEVDNFTNKLDIDVIGTDLLPNDHPDVIKHDFHIQKPEWINHFDMIYSNSTDHSHSPEQCIETWIEQLSDKGFLFIEWTTYHQNCNNVDCFGATLEEYEKLMEKYIYGRIELDDKRKTTVFVLRRK